MARGDRARTAAVVAAPVALAFGLAWLTGLAYRVDFPPNPAVPVDGATEPPVDLAAVQRAWPQGVGGRMAHARLNGFLQEVSTGQVALAAVPAVAVAAPATQLDLGTRLAAANPDKGRAFARVCGACHSFEQGGQNRIGPNLWGIVGRPIGRHPGFSYSPVLASEKRAWSYEALDSYLTNPARALPGNRMSFSGIRNAQDRANILAYLGTLGPQPLPYPAPKPL